MIERTLDLLTTVCVVGMADLLIFVIIAMAVILWKDMKRRKGRK